MNIKHPFYAENLKAGDICWKKHYLFLILKVEKINHLTYKIVFLDEKKEIFSELVEKSEILFGHSFSLCRVNQ